VERGGGKDRNRFPRLFQGVVHGNQSNQREEEDLNDQPDIRSPPRAYGFLIVPAQVVVERPQMVFRGLLQPLEQIPYVFRKILL